MYFKSLLGYTKIKNSSVYVALLSICLIIFHCEDPILLDGVIIESISFIGKHHQEWSWAGCAACPRLSHSHSKSWMMCRHLVWGFAMQPFPASCTGVLMKGWRECGLPGVVRGVVREMWQSGCRRPAEFSEVWVCQVEVPTDVHRPECPAVKVRSLLLVVFTGGSTD